MGYSEFIILKVINNYNKIFIYVFLEKKKKKQKSIEKFYEFFLKGLRPLGKPSSITEWSFVWPFSLNSLKKKDIK